MINEQQLIDILKRQVKGSSQKAVALKLGVTPQFLCDVLGRRRNISETLARALGYSREYVFIPRRGSK